MSARDRINELSRTHQLTVSHPPLKPRAGANLDRFCQDVVDWIAAPDVFEFRWTEAGLRLDREMRTHYPTIPDQEVCEAMRCPVPHRRMWLETDLRSYHGRTVTYAWLIDRIGQCGFRAVPVAVNQRRLIIMGAIIWMDADAAAKTDSFPRVDVYMMFEDYEREGELDEFWNHAELISRFMRILSHPSAIMEYDGGIPPAPAGEVVPGNVRSAIPPRATVRIDPDALRISGDEAAVRTHRSPVEHHRRAHLRRGRDGRVVQVRDCIVNRGGGA